MEHVFDTTVLQEDALTSLRVKENAARDGQVPKLPPFDDNDAFWFWYIQTNVMDPLMITFIEARLQKVADAYRVATDSSRKAVDSTLKI